MSELDEYAVSPNNIHLGSSFRVLKEDLELEMKAIRERNSESQLWNWSIDSLKQEWAAHVAFPAMGVFRSSFFTDVSTILTESSRK